MILSLILLLTALAGPTLAQDVMVFCGDLAEADCALMKEASAASFTLQSGTTDLDVKLSISNIPDTPFESLTFRLSGSGAYSIDPAILETMEAYQNNPAAMFADTQMFSAWFLELLKGISGKLNLTLELPAEVLAMMPSEDGSLPNNLSFGLLLVDGFGYINLDDVAAALPDAGIPVGWLGVDLATFMEMALAQSGFGGDSAMDPEAFQAYMNSFQDAEAMSAFMTVERLADTTVTGQPAAVFLTTFDYGAFFQSDIFQQMMETQMAVISAAAGEELSAADQAEMSAAISQMGPIFEAINLEIRQVIGLEDKYIHSTEMHMDWDMTSFMAMADPQADGPAPRFTFDLAVSTGDFNVPQDIAAPADAMIFPLETMLSEDAA
jgi:hypothetical protein